MQKPKIQSPFALLGFDPFGSGLQYFGPLLYWTGQIPIYQDRIDILIGPSSSHLTKAAAEICDVHQTLLWNHGGASDEICHAKSHRIVSTLSPASQYLRKLPRNMSFTSGQRSRVISAF